MLMAVGWSFESRAIEILRLAFFVTAAITLAKKHADGEEIMMDFLEEGEFADLMAGTYFYLTSKWVLQIHSFRHGIAVLLWNALDQ